MDQPDGLQFSPAWIRFPEKAAAGDVVSMELEIRNVGSAPCYKALPLVLRMTGTGGTQDFVQDTDIRKWLPGNHSVSLRAALPRQMAPGEYSLELGLLCPHADVVYLATNAPRNGSFYRLGTITVTE